MTPPTLDLARLRAAGFTVHTSQGALEAIATGRNCDLLNYLRARYDAALIDTLRHDPSRTLAQLVALDALGVDLAE